MRTLIFMALVLSCSLFPQQLQAEEPEADPQANLDTAIPEMIRLLEAKEHVAFLKKFADPIQLKEITSKKTVEEVAARFGDTKAERLVKMLKEIKGAKPELKEDGSVAIYERRDADMPRPISFRRIDKKWYLMN